MLEVGTRENGEFSLHLTEEELSKVPITPVDGMNDRWRERPEFFAHL